MSQPMDSQKTKLLITKTVDFSEFFYQQQTLSSVISKISQNNQEQYSFFEKSKK